MFGWSLVVGLPFTVIILKLSLSAGIIPGMVRSARAPARTRTCPGERAPRRARAQAIPIAMIGWVTLMWWVRAAERCGFRGTRPFTVMARPPEPAALCSVRACGPGREPEAGLAPPRGRRAALSGHQSCPPLPPGLARSAGSRSARAARAPRRRTRSS